MCAPSSSKASPPPPIHPRSMAIRSEGPQRTCRAQSLVPGEAGRVGGTWLLPPGAPMHAAGAHVASLCGMQVAQGPAPPRLAGAGTCQGHVPDVDGEGPGPRAPRGVAGHRRPYLELPWWPLMPGGPPHPPCRLGPVTGSHNQASSVSSAHLLLL